jgi:hypothetical protein
MNLGGKVVVDETIFEQASYFFAHQPPIFGVVVAYAAACFFMFHITRGKGYMIAGLTSWLYLIPMWMH